MTRFLRLMCIGCCTAAFAVACGDDDGKGGDGMEDGGVVTPDDLDELGNQVTGLEGDLQELESTVTDGLADLNTGLMGANGDIMGLQGDVDDLQGRIEDLITPDNCSVEEICVPDGVAVTALAMTSLITAVCEKEFNCCDTNELAVRLGKGVEDVGDCVKRVVDMLENGQSPDIDLYWTNLDVIDNAVTIAAAINSNDVQVGIDADKVAECAAVIDEIECNEEEEGVEEPENCEQADYEEESDPCSPDEIVIGLQQEGELCGVTGVNECADGLDCNPINGEEIFTAVVPGSGVLGICMPPSAVDDACRQDANCTGEEQYCDAESNTCQERGSEGDPCGYVDDTFTVFSSSGQSLNPNWQGWGLQNPIAVKKECKRGLWCDPTSEECVNNCSEHALCWGNSQCPEGMICNHTEVPGLWTTFNGGLCTDPIEEGDSCTQAISPLPNGEYASTECDTERCADVGDGAVCVDARTEDGGDCDEDVAEPDDDPTCASNFCNADNECATLCNDHSDCPDDFFCNTSQFSLGMYVCEPKGGTGDICTQETAGNDLSNHVQCASERCLDGLCAAAKVASGELCTNHGDCADDQFCGYDSTATPEARNECMDFLAEGGDCAAQEGMDWACGPDAYCGDAGTNAGLCTDIAGDGDSCDPVNDVRCDLDGDDDIDENEDDFDCMLVDVDEYECHKAGEYPNGTGCGFNDDCDSNFCIIRNGSTCEDPIEGGEVCDADDPTMWYCEEGFYCDHDPDAEGADIGKGECKEQKSVGDGCEPRYDNYVGGPLNVHDCQGEADDVYYSNQCLLIGDEFVCGPGAYEDSLQCDGN